MKGLLYVTENVTYNVTENRAEHGDTCVITATREACGLRSPWRGKMEKEVWLK
jgi:hypothetical protein